MATVRLFDNGGETFDRYTAIFRDANDDYVGYRGMSADPFHPQGFGIWDDGDVSGTMARDEEIPVTSAPEAVQRCIASDLRDVEIADAIAPHVEAIYAALDALASDAAVPEPRYVETLRDIARRCLASADALTATAAGK